MLQRNDAFLFLSIWNFVKKKKVTVFRKIK